MSRKIVRAFSALLPLLMLCGCGTVDLTMGNDTDSSDISSDAQSTTQQTTVMQTPLPEESSEPVVYGDDFVECDAAICYDLTAEEIIYSKNAEERVYPASLTKLITALTAINYTSPEYIYTVGSEVGLIEPDSSMAWIAWGETYQRDAILTAMLTPSGNDAAYCIAVNVARKIYGEDISDTEAVEYFAVLMNDYAKKLGVTNSNFVVPDGYHNDNHYTTPMDMLKISIEAAKSDTMTAITSQPLAVVYDEQGYTHSWKNGNILLEDTTVPYNVYGLKIGFTDEAGFCFAGYAEYNGKEIITLTFNCNLEYRFADTKKLTDLGFGLYDEDIDYYEEKSAEETEEETEEE